MITITQNVMHDVLAQVIPVQRLVECMKEERHCLLFSKSNNIFFICNEQKRKTFVCIVVAIFRILFVCTKTKQKKKMTG